MAWEIIPPRLAGRTDASRRELVTVGWRRQSLKSPPKLAIAPSRALAPQLGWQRKGRVEAHIDRDAGLLCLRPAEEGWAVYAGASGRALSVYIELPGVKHDLRSPEPAEYFVEDGALIVTLPAWVLGDQPAPEPAPVVVAAPATNQDTEDRAEARTMLIAGSTAATLAEYFGWTLPTAQAFVVEVLPGLPSHVRARLVAAPEGELWTPERDDLLRQLWPQTSMSGAEIYQRITALPGAKPGRNSSMYSRARLLGLPTKRGEAYGWPAPVMAPVVDPAPVLLAAMAPEPVPAPAPAPMRAGPPPKPTMDELRAEARDMFLLGKFGRDVADELGVALSTVSNWASEWRAEAQPPVVSRKEARA